jgi:aspartyl-tRNA(Asn)/glutamyl-tRNA(Gln) amidotransferase subunit B
MEKGMVRCDVNVSVRPKGTKELGAKIEIKNMNSFSGVRRALEYEIPRQIEIVKRGEKLIQSTRRWDDVGGVTEEMRTKEHAHDYRYFPEPDLMPFEPTEKRLEEISARVVELPLARKQRFMRDYQLPASDAETFKNDKELGDYFEPIAKQAKNPKMIANLIINRVNAELSKENAVRKIKAEELYRAEPNPNTDYDAAKLKLQPVTLSDLRFNPTNLIELADLLDTRTISSSAAQTVFSEMFETGKSPSVIVQEKGLAQVSDSGAIEKFCDEAIVANPNSVADYKNGKIAALNFLKGQVMKLSKGKANPNLVGEILEKKLKS